MCDDARKEVFHDNCFSESSITLQYVLIKQYQEMPVLLRRLRDNPEFAQQVFSEANQQQDEEE